MINPDFYEFRILQRPTLKFKRRFFTKKSFCLPLGNAKYYCGLISFFWGVLLEYGNLSLALSDFLFFH